MNSAITKAEAVACLRAEGCVFAEREVDLIWSCSGDDEVRTRRVAERASGTPLEYVVGCAEFAGVVVEIGPPVFVPRHRAEALVLAALTYGADRDLLTVLDLGCGCGAIAAALARRRSPWQVHASDVDELALIYARRNATTYGFDVHRSNWFTQLPEGMRGRFDLVVAHLPYVPTSELALLPRDFRDHEATTAVDGGDDGLDPWRAVCASADPWLRTGGLLLTQVARHQATGAVAIAAECGWAADVAASADPTEESGEDADVVVLVAGRAPGPRP